MAEQLAVNTAYVVPLAADLDDITAAAMANPGMSSWAALTSRAQLRQGESVLINGANGASVALSASVLRSGGLELMDSGLGSVSHIELVQVIASMLRAAYSAGLSIAAEARPLSEVEGAWMKESNRRIVFSV
jgi:hypothetical protein